VVLLVRTHASYDCGTLVRRQAFKDFCGNRRVKLLGTTIYRQWICH
jgi:hypothetical protein